MQEVQMTYSLYTGYTHADICDALLSTSYRFALSTNAITMARRGAVRALQKDKHEFHADRIMPCATFRTVPFQFSSSHSFENCPIRPFGALVLSIIQFTKMPSASVQSGSTAMELAG
jgi:hypothetical protein